ncbi:hypothetical protein [Carboxylicivirga caseinilyticus]|uniref:hypothetical protein n=1 Tax=Carboxylicivirga caseinilyticus TaxID=3417572 RepID=UPI003D343682|nr:hypothetical protein [Marinilabiliaceae bacterium A049]
MKNLTVCLIVCFLITILSSCTSYQIITLDSSLNKPSNNGFVYENDTILLQYTFNGANAPLDVDIFNKLNAPLYINWNESSVIINGQSYPLNPSQSKVSIDYSEVSSEYLYNTYTQGSGDGTIWHSDRSGFIPPQSNITIQSMNTWNQFISSEHSIGQNTYISASGEKITEYKFDKESSPLELRCYLSYKDQTADTWKFVDHQFWIQSFYKCLDCSLPKESNKFYLSKSTGAGTAIGVVALVGLAAVAVSLDVDIEDSDL